MKKLYFVIETKGSADQLDLRRSEDLKIRCGKVHFENLGTGAELHGPVSDWKELKIQAV